MSILKNWKTSAAGAMMIVGGILSLLGVKTGIDPAAAGASILAGFGLIFAKDGNVTGGTNPQ